MLELFPCGSCEDWLGLGIACPECIEARRGGPVFQEKMNRLIQKKLARIAHLKQLGRIPSIGLVGCGKSKKRYAEGGQGEGPVYQARHLYIGRLFRDAFHASEVMCDETYIISAKHGLLHPEDLVETYDYSIFDLRLADRPRWGQGVLTHLTTLFPQDMQLSFVFLAGRGYVNPIAEAISSERIPWECTDPMKGMDLFERMKWLAQYREPQVI